MLSHSSAQNHQLAHHHHNINNKLLGYINKSSFGLAQLMTLTQSFPISLSSISSTLCWSHINPFGSSNVVCSAFISEFNFCHNFAQKPSLPISHSLSLRLGIDFTALRKPSLISVLRSAVPLMHHSSLLSLSFYVPHY